jgi:hypothetical protein
MADIIYTVNQDDPNSIQGFEQFSQADRNLIGTFEVNNLFDSSKNLAELHILSLSDTLLESDYNYSNYKQLGNAQSAGKSGASVLTVDPIEDSKLYGYQYGGVKLLYHFLNDLYTTKKERIPFYIESISPDRTELRLQSLDLSNDDIKLYTQAIKDRLLSQSYFNEFRLNFDNNDLFIGINIDVVESNSNSYVAVKLYEPLPVTYDLKSTTYINEVISDSVAFEVDSLTTIETVVAPTLRSPNFNLEVADQSVIPTGYYSYNDLFSYPVNNTNSQIFSLYNEKGAEISIDHTDYSNFVHFSSAYERLVNFKYKLQLIETYSASLAQINTAASQSVGTTGSNITYNNLIQGVINNFDHYERFLYYQSSSYAWPKSNTVKPYINIPSSDTTAVNWYANQLATANGYDLSNGNILINSIPTYLRDDPNNENYLTFIYMIGQHFDNLWIYSKAVTDKYDADNRADFGISKDLVAEALKNFGVKVYTSNKSIGDLFDSFIGQGYQSGSEVINYLITGSITGSNIPVVELSYDDYNKEVQKRIYHNLSHLLKTKGTERGLRALINCFGISSDILKIKLYGGRNVDERPFYGDYEYYTSSLDKIRLDHTGSLVTGSTLSSYTSIYKRDPKYTDDLHAIEVGFSPTDNIDNYIVSYSLATGSLSSFNIDDYIGDPRSLTADTYGLLNTSGSVVYSLSDLTNKIMSGSTAYDVFDYVRLIKFFDNTIFKMVRDFIPARVTADTGIIIKPHLLQRNKAKSPILSGSRPEHTGSIDTAFIKSTDGETFGGRNNYSTAYSESIQTPTGLTNVNFLHGQEQPKYNGEFNGSTIDPTNGELNEANPYKDLSIGGYNFGEISFVSSSNESCLLSSIPASPYIITSSTFNLTINGLFNFPREATIYSISSIANITGSGTPGNPYSTTTLPFNLSGYGNYDQFYISASSPDTVEQPCTSLILIRFATCSLFVSPVGSVQANVRQGTAVPSTNLTTWFVTHSLQTQVQYTASYGTTEEGIPDPTDYSFNQTLGTSVTIKVVDPYSSNCQTSVTVTVGQCTFAAIPTGSATRGLEFDFSEYGKICPPARTLAANEAPVALDVSNNAIVNSTVNNILNGNIFNQYGVPVDECIGFLPKYLQKSKNTPTSEFGIPPSPFILQPGKDRGLQSYLSPYCPIPGQGLQIPADITFNVYTIKNSPEGDLEDDSKYLHTATNPTGTDTYVAYLSYAQLDSSAIGIQETVGLLSAALGVGINMPQDPDIAGPTATSATDGLYRQLLPIYFVAPPLNYLGPVSSQGIQTIYPYTTGDKTHARTNLPVAYHIQAFSGGGINCISSITIYPSTYTRILSPPAVNGLTVLPNSLNNWQAVSSTEKYIFVDKSVNINYDQLLWGENPSGGAGTVMVPIRKRALI